MILAAVVAGYMTICSGPAGDCQFQARVHGHGDRRDCGTHEFTQDDGTVTRVTIGCETKK